MVLQSYEVVHPQWVDYNGHMRDAFYGVACSSATDDLMDVIGMDCAYRKRTGNTLYTVEMHLHFVDEVKVDARLLIETFIIEFDAKRLHLWQGVKRFVDDTLLCAQETMLLNVNQGDEVRTVPFDDVIAPRLQKQFDTQGEYDITDRLRARAMRCPPPK